MTFKPLLYKRLLALGAVISASSTAAASACPHANLPRLPIFSTIAGTGAPGTADGAALTAATFIEPAAVALAQDGSIVVADAGANDVRRLSNGVVSSVAGVAPEGMVSAVRQGGYGDGPAADARFNRPVGIAIAKDGTIYIADSLNRAVRKIHNGMVSSIGKGQLDEPRAVALDADDNLYIADRGTGVRKVLANGLLSTVDSISSSANRKLCGIAVRGSGASLEIAYSSTTEIHVTAGTRDRTVRFDQVVEPVFEQRQLGRACSLSFVDADSLIFSDPTRNALRFLRLALAPPVGEAPTSRLLGSGTSEIGATVGGFADGPANVASLDDPRGTLVLPNGDIVFADSGNRRIRMIRGVDSRHPASVDESGSLVLPKLDPSAYRVVVISNSLAFSDAMWTDSIAGEVERGLIAANTAGVLPKCPDVATYRFSGSGVAEFASFLESYYGEGEADLVILLVDGGTLAKDQARDIARTNPPGANIANVNAVADYASGWKLDVARRLNELSQKLVANGTAFSVVFSPDARSVSPLENEQSDSIPAEIQDFYTDEKTPYGLTYKMALDYENLIVTSGPHSIRLLQKMIEAEGSSNRAAFFNEQDDHLSADGDIFIGRTIVNDLKSWKPWKTGER